MRELLLEWKRRQASSMELAAVEKTTSRLSEPTKKENSFLVD